MSSTDIPYAGTRFSELAPRLKRCTQALVDDWERPHRFDGAGAAAVYGGCTAVDGGCVGIYRGDAAVYGGSAVLFMQAMLLFMEFLGGVCGVMFVGPRDAWGHARRFIRASHKWQHCRL
eukprot:3044066-Rhodomonas_salina.2